MLKITTSGTHISAPLILRSPQSQQITSNRRAPDSLHETVPLWDSSEVGYADDEHFEFDCFSPPISQLEISWLSINNCLAKIEHQLHSTEQDAIQLSDSHLSIKRKNEIKAICQFGIAKVIQIARSMGDVGGNALNVQELLDLQEQVTQFSSEFNAHTSEFDCFEIVNESISELFEFINGSVERNSEKIKKNFEDDMANQCILGSDLQSDFTSTFCTGIALLTNGKVDFKIGPLLDSLRYEIENPAIRPDQRFIQLMKLVKILHDIQTAIRTTDVFDDEIRQNKKEMAFKAFEILNQRCHSEMDQFHGRNKNALFTRLQVLKYQYKKFDGSSDGIAVLNHMIDVARLAIFTPDGTLDKESTIAIAMGFKEFNALILDSSEQLALDDVAARCFHREAEQEETAFSQNENRTSKIILSSRSDFFSRRQLLVDLQAEISALTNLFAPPPADPAIPNEPISEMGALKSKLEELHVKMKDSMYGSLVERMLAKLEIIDKATPPLIMIDDRPVTNDDPASKEIIEARWQEIMGLFNMLYSSLRGSEMFSESVHVDLDNLAPMLNQLCPKLAVQADPRSKLGFLKLFNAVRAGLKGVDRKKISPTLEVIREILLRREELNIEDWEFISLKLEKLVQLIPCHSEDFIHNGFKIGFLKKNLDYLAFVSGAMWLERSHRFIVDHLTNQRYKEKFNESFSESDTHTVSISASMPFLSTRLAVSRTKALVTDDEGYLGRVDTTKFAGGVSGNLGVDSVKLASVGIEGSVTRGSYEEWSKIRHYVLTNLNELLLEHSKKSALSGPVLRIGDTDFRFFGTGVDNELQVHLTRHQSNVLPVGLRTEMISKIAPSDDDNLRLSRTAKDIAQKYDVANPGRYRYMVERLKIDMHYMDAIRQTYAMQSSRMAQTFSVLLSVSANRIPERFVEDAAFDGAKIKPDLLNIEQAKGLNLPYTVIAGKVTSTVGLESELGSLNLTGALEASSAGVLLTTYTPLCEKLQSTFDEGIYNSTTEGQATLRNEMALEIIKKSRGIRSKLDKEDLAYSKLRLLDRATYKTLDYDPSKESAVEEAFLRSAGGIWADAPQNESPTARSSRLKRALEHVKATFQQYEKIQSSLANGGAPALESLSDIHKMFGVESAEKFMYRLLLLNAWIYTQTLESENTKEIIDFRIELATNEAAMLNYKFPVNQKVLEEHTSYQQECELTVKDIKLGAAATAAIAPSTLEVLGMGMLQIVVSVLQRFREHVNPFRHGNYRDVEVRLSAGIALGSRAKCVEYIYNAITSKAGTECRIGPEDTQNIEKFLDSVTAVTGTLVLNFKWYKPTLFPSLGYRFWNMRASVAGDATFSVNTPTPFISAGYSYEKVRTGFLYEIYSTSSMLLFGLRFFHDYCIDDVNQKTGAITAESYYGGVRKLKAETLKSLFSNTGRQHTMGYTEYSVLKELDAIEKEIGTIAKNRTENMKQINIARDELMRTAAAFYKTDSEENYTLALAAFEKLLFTYSPHLLAMKRRSALFKPKKFELLDTSYHSENEIWDKLSGLFQRTGSPRSRTTNPPAVPLAIMRNPPAFPPPAAQPAG